MLSNPLVCRILRKLENGPQQQVELRRTAGSPAQTTLRNQLGKLQKLGLVEKRQHRGFPGATEVKLTHAGQNLLRVAEPLERWLATSPQEPLSLGGELAKAAIKALTEAWSTTMLRALAARPLSLTELDRVIGPVTYPALERRLDAMRLVGQIEACPSNGNGTPYAATVWLRKAAQVLAAAARWEQDHLDSGTPIASIDAEAIFLLGVPLLAPPEELEGSCRMVTELQHDTLPAFAGVVVEVAEGRIDACTTRIEGTITDAWAAGSIGAWLAAMIDAEVDRLELGGDSRLAHSLVEGLHSSLSSTPRRSLTGVGRFVGPAVPR